MLTNFGWLAAYFDPYSLLLRHRGCRSDLKHLKTEDDARLGSPQWNFLRIDRRRHVLHPCLTRTN